MKAGLFGKSAALLLLGMPVQLASVAPARAQEAAAEENDIVVTARRSGAPMWTITTDRGVIILVGDFAKVPEATPWRPERLQAATAGAQRVILGTKASVTVGDVFRILFAGGRLRKLPKGTVAADYLDPELLSRLRVLEQRYGKDYSRGNFLLTAFDLLQNRLKFDDDTTRDASDVVRNAAGKARVPTRPVGTIRGREMIDNLFEADARTHIPCLRAAIAAVEVGPEIVTARGRAWTEFDVPAVMRNPLEVALGACWPWNGDGFGEELRGQWVQAIGEAAGQPGVTLAVVPLRVLAEQGGVLDQLQGRGFAIKGPAWR
jgi:hypothetical protein